MARQARAVGMVLAVLVVNLSGCQRFHHEKTVTISPGEAHSFFVDAPKSEQKVTVEVDAQGTPVNVYVLFEEHENAIKQKVLAEKSPDPAQLLASKEKVTSDKLQVTVPGGKSFGVILGGATKQTQVKLKLSGS